MILKTIPATFSPSGRKWFLLQREVNKTLGATEGFVTGHLRGAVSSPLHTHIHAPSLCQFLGPVTCLVLQQVILLHELPMGLQSLGSTGQVEGIRVSVQQVLEGLQGRLAGLEGKKHTLGIWVSLLLSLPYHPCPLSQSPAGAGKSDSYCRPGSQAWLSLRTRSTKALQVYMRLQAVEPPRSQFSRLAGSRPAPQHYQPSALPIPLCSAAALQPC